MCALNRFADEVTLLCTIPVYLPVGTNGARGLSYCFLHQTAFSLPYLFDFHRSALSFCAKERAPSPHRKLFCRLFGPRTPPRSQNRLPSPPAIVRGIREESALTDRELNPSLLASRRSSRELRHPGNFFRQRMSLNRKELSGVTVGRAKSRLRDQFAGSFDLV